jgi:predicted nuclease of predicted toxin-antitoxin system
VRNVALERADDLAIWDFARENGLVVVSKDADFHQLSFALGHPPKVVWIKRGNCSTREVERLLRRELGAIEAFEREIEASFLVIE